MYTLLYTLRYTWYVHTLRYTLRYTRFNTLRYTLWYTLLYMPPYTPFVGGYASLSPFYTRFTVGRYCRLRPVCTYGRKGGKMRRSEASPSPVSLLGEKGRPLPSTRFTVGLRRASQTPVSLLVLPQGPTFLPVFMLVCSSGTSLSARFYAGFVLPGPPFLPVLGWFCTPRTSPFACFMPVFSLPGTLPEVGYSLPGTLLVHPGYLSPWYICPPRYT